MVVGTALVLGDFGSARNEVQTPCHYYGKCQVLSLGRLRVGEDAQTQGELASLAQRTFHQMYKHGVGMLLVLGLETGHPYS